MAKRIAAPFVLLLMIVLIVMTARDYFAVAEHCERTHGVVVKGAWLHDTGLSGYVCVEQGRHGGGES